MNNQLAVIQEHIHATQQAFEEISVNHKAVVWREESEFALQAFNKNPYLTKCDPLTVQTAIKNVASVGLTLNPAHQLAYLVPEYNTQTKKQDCQLRISFQGLIRLATNSGSIKIVKAEIVYANDTFKYKGALEMPLHEMDNPFKTADRGDVIGVYCIAITHENRVICDLMSWDEVLKIKSAAKTQMVWDKWPLEMAKKAVIKRAYKQWPKTEKSTQLVEAVNLLNQQEGNKDDNEVLEEFEEYLYKKTPLDFFLFVKSLDEDIYNEMYNSGAKGEKIKLKEKFADKEKIGSAEVRDLINNVRSEDDEIKEEAIEFIDTLTEKFKQVLRDLMKS